MKKIIIGSLWMVLHVTATAQSKKLTLQQCLETALNNNLQVNQSNLQMQSAQVNWQQARANMLPNIAGSINYGANQGRSIDPFTNTYINQQLNFSNLNVDGNIPLFNGFQLQNQVKQNNLAFQATKMEFQQAKDNLTLNVILSYLLVLNNEDVLDLAKAQMEVTKKQVERLDLLNKEGAIAPYTFTDLKGQYASDEVSVTNAQNSVQSSKLTLAQLMNVPYDESAELERINVNEALALYEGSPDKIYEEATAKLGIVKAADLRKQSAEKGIKVARGGYSPTLSLFGGLGTSYSSAASLSSLVSESYGASDSYVTVNGTNYQLNVKQQTFKNEPFGLSKQYNNNQYTNFGVALRVPIANNLRARNQVKLAQITYKNTQLISDNTKIQLRQNIEQAHFNMTAAYNRYQSFQNQVTALEESFKAAEVRFENGVINSVEYLQVKNNLDRARLNLTQSKYEYVLRTKVLDYYQGKLSW
ncbi:MAG: TolC family protein [Sphingobacteriales bacterium]|nr:TolC family protein [Sphingobacteriales bacterium]MBI3717175.1 TolC family protein [Sphingobacteriales bacterium]